MINFASVSLSNHRANTSFVVSTKLNFLFSVHSSTLKLQCGAIFYMKFIQIVVFITLIFSTVLLNALNQGNRFYDWIENLCSFKRCLFAAISDELIELRVCASVLRVYMSDCNCTCVKCFRYYHPHKKSTIVIHVGTKQKISNWFAIASRARFPSRASSISIGSGCRINWTRFFAEHQFTKRFVDMDLCRRGCIKNCSADWKWDEIHFMRAQVIGSNANDVPFRAR